VDVGLAADTETPGVGAKTRPERVAVALGAQVWLGRRGATLARSCAARRIRFASRACRHCSVREGRRAEEAR
jgi:hypothetical protein